MGKPKQHGSTEAHIRLTLKMLQSPAYIALSDSAARLLVDLRSSLRSTNNGNISATFSTLVHRGWNSPTTLAKALRQLEAAGFIAKTRTTIGVHRGSKLCNLYRFTDMEAFAHPKLFVEAHKATNDYLKFQSLTEAKRVIKAASATKTQEKLTQ